MRDSICTTIFLIANVVNAIVISELGYGVNTWRYWIGIVCVCTAYIAGRAQG